MILCIGLDDSAGGLFFVFTVVSDPGFAKDMATETAGPFFALPIEFFELGFGFAEIKCVGAGAESDDRFAAIEVIHEVGHLVVGQVAETQEHDDEVGGIERFHARNVFGVVGIYLAALRVDRK